MSLILRWENIHIYISNYYKKHTHTAFSVILADILRVGKKHFLGNLYASYFRKLSHKAYAQRIPLFFRGKTSAAFPDGSSTTYRLLCKTDR